MSNPNRLLDTLEVLDRLKTQMPAIFDQARVVGRWVWIEFDSIPAVSVREYLKDLGFIWNRNRSAWQHACGYSCRPARGYDPRAKYGEVNPNDMSRFVAAGLGEVA